ERGGLVEKEQLGVAALLHHLAVAAFELKDTGNPLLADPAPGSQRPVRQMQGAAAVAHHETAVRRGDDLAFWRHAVLERPCPRKRAFGSHRRPVALAVASSNIAPFAASGKRRAASRRLDAGG